MGEEVKKSRPAPDPNSAKFKLGQIAAKAYSDAIEAKAAARECVISVRARAIPMISAHMQELLLHT